MVIERRAIPIDNMSYKTVWNKSEVEILLAIAAAIQYHDFINFHGHLTELNKIMFNVSGKNSFPTPAQRCMFYTVNHKKRRSKNEK